MADPKQTAHTPLEKIIADCDVIAKKLEADRKLIAALVEALEAIRRIARSENHAPCRSGGIDEEGVCPNTCVCEMRDVDKLAEAALRAARGE